MRIKYLILLPVIAFLIFSSCQREGSFEFPGVNNGSDSIYLKQYIELDTTQPAGLDTLNKATISYDAMKRITSFNYYSVTFNQSAVATYFYLGNDTLPYKVVVYSEDFIDKYRDTSFYLYSSNGIVSKDSTISYDVTTGNDYFGTFVKAFSPSGNNTLIQSRQYFSLPATTPVNQWTGALLQNRVNGNLVLQDDTSTYHVLHSIRDHQEAAYDNNINPFHRISVRYPINDFDTQKNNVIEERMWDAPGVHERHTRQSYIYRSDGYPISVTITDVINGDKTKGVFIYTN